MTTILWSVIGFSRKNKIVLTSAVLCQWSSLPRPHVHQTNVRSETAGHSNTYRMAPASRRMFTPAIAA